MSVQLWAFYIDLEESLGTFASTRAAYERVVDLKVATPPIMINYALFLEEHNHFEDAFQVYERGVTLFEWPQVRDIWTTYLTKFVARFVSSTLVCT